MATVFLLWHSCDVKNPPEDAKLLGVYSSRDRARNRIATASRLPGFAARPDCFVIDEYEVDRDEWVAGFDLVLAGGRTDERPDPHL